MTKTNPHLSVIIRASGEATLPALQQRLQKQLKPGDHLEVLDNMSSFEVKLRQGFLLAKKFNTAYTLFIDADVLVKSNVLNKIRRLSTGLQKHHLGFGLQVWDRFYHQPKYRGMHIYQNHLIDKALALIPDEGEQIRPESYIKNTLRPKGIIWYKGFTNYIAGIHDFGQHPSDIYYKFLIRSVRAEKDELLRLKYLFNQKKKEKDFVIALQALDNTFNAPIVNKKINLRDKMPDYDDTKPAKLPHHIDFYIFKHLLYRYGISRKFFNSF